MLFQVDRCYSCLIDGHSSHFTLELVQTAAEQDVVIFCLPPHTTADSQPLNTSVFGPLKSYWSQACHDYMFANPDNLRYQRNLHDISKVLDSPVLVKLLYSKVMASFTSDFDRHSHIYIIYTRIQMMT